jgi:hypothetical protein
MTGYLRAVAERALGAIPMLTPRAASRFEDTGDAATEVRVDTPAPAGAEHARRPHEPRAPEPRREAATRPPRHAEDEEIVAARPRERALADPREIEVEALPRAEAASPSRDDRDKQPQRRRTFRDATVEVPEPHVAGDEAGTAVAEGDDAIDAPAPVHADARRVRPAPGTAPAPADAEADELRPTRTATTTPPRRPAAAPAAAEASPSIPASAAVEHVAEPDRETVVVDVSPASETVRTVAARARTTREARPTETRTASPAAPSTVQASRPQTEPADPVVHVTIGRIEVRPETPRRPPQHEPAPPRPQPERSSLDRYLERRNGTAR